MQQKKWPRAKPSGKQTRRIVVETQRMLRDPAPGIVIKAHAENYRHFDVAIEGPEGTPYEKGVFKLELFLPAGYPMKPPKARFRTKIYHPNVDKLGRICLDVLKDKWTPALRVKTLCQTIQLLMQNPNPKDPLDTRVADVFEKNPKLANQTAREWTKKYAN